MARTSATLTQNEVNEFQAFCDQHHIVCDDSAEGQKNGDLLGGLIVMKSQVDITPATLAAAYAQLKDHLVHYTPAQQSWNTESRSLTQADKDRILNYVRSSKNLKSDGDNLLVNATALANWITSHNYSVGNPSLDVILSQVAAQSRYPLVKQVHLQGSEAEAQAAREAAVPQQTAKHSDDDVPSYVPAALKEHYRQNQRAMKQKESATPITPAESMTYFEKASRELVANVTSNNDRETAAQFLKNDGGNWEFTYRRIRTFLERRTQERNSVGR